MKWLLLPKQTHRNLSHSERSYRSSKSQQWVMKVAAGVTTPANAFSVMKLQWIACLICWETLNPLARILSVSPMAFLDHLRRLVGTVGACGWSCWFGASLRSRFSSRGLQVFDAPFRRSRLEDQIKTEMINHHLLVLPSTEAKLEAMIALLGLKNLWTSWVSFFFYFIVIGKLFFVEGFYMALNEKLSDFFWGFMYMFRHTTKAA